MSEITKKQLWEIVCDTELKNGLLYTCSVEVGKLLIKYMRSKHGFKYGNGEIGKGLYSPSWDRQMGEFNWDQFQYNPSLLHYYVLPEIVDENTLRSKSLKDIISSYKSGDTFGN